MQPDLFDFFIHFNCLLPIVQSEDTSIRYASPKETEDAIQAVKELKGLVESKLKLLAVSFPNPAARGSLEYVIAPPHASPWVPVGLWTQTSIGYDIQRKRNIFMKDFWRLDIEGVPKKGNIYSKFKTNKVPNVPCCLNLGDVGNPAFHSTQTNHYTTKPWAPNFKYRLTLQCHYHLILDDIGQPLDSFKCSQDMMHAIHATLAGKVFLDRVEVCLSESFTPIAYKFAYDYGILHCDISPGNILITSDDNFAGGLLIDWDLCKDINSQVGGQRCALRTVRIKCPSMHCMLTNWTQGTWQFMAADLISNPKTDHTFVHNLESAFYVILWLSIKFLPNSWDGAVCSLVMNDLFNPPTFKLVGSQAKVNWMAHAIAQTREFRVDGNPILSGLITSLTLYFQA